MAQLSITYTAGEMSFESREFMSNECVQHRMCPAGDIGNGT
jgi:hypothetical protein